MALTNYQKGAKCAIVIGRKGERGDLIPARIASDVTIQNTPRGPQRFADLVIARTTLEGVEILQSRTLQNLYFAFDRSNVVEMLDGPEGSPKPVAQVVAEANESLMNHLQGGTAPAAVDLDSL